MGSEAADDRGEHANSQPARTPRTNGKGRMRQDHVTEAQRFFLAESDRDQGVPELGKECATEPEAIVESLKTGRSYFTVSEWRGIADFSGNKPELKRQGVTRTLNTS